jgi:hypothetical protein
VNNIVVVTFTEPSKAYEAFSSVRALDNSGRISLRTAVVVERQADGKPIVQDATEGFTLLDVPSGLLGRMIDGLAGTDDQVQIATRIPAGTTGLMVEADEYAVEVIDGTMAALGGTVYRESSDQVKAEFKADEDASREAAKKEKQAERAERRNKRERERAERHNARLDGVEKRLNRLESWVEGKKESIPSTSNGAAQPAASTAAEAAPATTATATTATAEAAQVATAPAASQS